MEIGKDLIQHIANLSMLNLSDEEVEKYTKDMEQIVEFANSINNVDTTSVQESNFVSDAKNVFREDVIKPSFDKDELLSNAPSSNGEAYSIPNVMD